MFQKMADSLVVDGGFLTVGVSEGRCDGDSVGLSEGETVGLPEGDCRQNIREA